MIGSSSAGFIFGNVSRKQFWAQTMNAMSELSTSWYLPSLRSILMPTTGKPATGPLASMLRKPFSMAGMKFVGMRPPRIVVVEQQFAFGLGRLLRPSSGPSCRRCGRTGPSRPSASCA